MMQLESNPFSEEYVLDNDHIQKALRFKMVKEPLSKMPLVKEPLVKKEFPLSKMPIKEKEEKEKEEDFKPKIYTPSQEDSLFWCYFIIINGFTKYEMLPSIHSLTAKQMKIELVSLIRNNKDLLKTYKFDSFTNLESNLANDTHLNIKTFMALSVIANINVIYIRKKTYFESWMNDSSDVYVITEQKNGSKYVKKFGFECIHKDSFFVYKELYKIEKLDKPIKAISGYHVEELLNICTKLGIDTLSNEKGKEKKKSKKELYEAIVQYF
jgi:hypothetical protein